MVKIITIGNQKGGVGKTSTTQSMAAGLIKKGYKVLSIDLDPQKNLSSSFQAEMQNVPNILDLLNDQSTFDETLSHDFTKYIQSTHSGDIIPSTSLLSTADMKFVSVIGREKLLKNAIMALHGSYDYILIDTPPALGVLTLNAFTASNTVVVPMRVDRFSMDGLGELYSTIQTIRKQVNTELKISGILLTVCNPRTAISKALTLEIRSVADKIGWRVFKTFIRRSVSVEEAQLEKANMLDYAPKATAQKDYATFIDEFLSYTGV